MSVNQKSTWNKIKLLLVTAFLLTLLPFYIKNVFAESENPVDAQRPIILSTNLSVNGKLIQASSMTNVPEDATIIVTVQDNLPMSHLNEKINDLIILQEGNSVISGATLLKVVDETGNIYELTFKPTNKLELGRKFKVTISSALVDDNGNAIAPVFFNFNTVVAKKIESPHGSFTGNKNACFNCHGTGKSEVDVSAVTNYCMSCHDGTAATAVVGSAMTFTHSSNENGLTPSDCANCHDPHLKWSEANPNSLRTHTVFNHQTRDINSKVENILDKNGMPIGMRDSAIQSCTSCHGPGTARVVNLATSEKINGNPNPYFQSEMTQTYVYNNMATSKGTPEDFSLCFKCHNGESAAKAQASNKKLVDIEQYYQYTDSGHKISMMNTGMVGYLACADCHETHGSKNVSLLKSELGHGNNATEFSATEWTAQKEREFCLKCHNNSTTLYGTVAEYGKVTKAGTENPGHQDSITIACSTCHGNGDIVKASHAPTR